MRTAVPCSADWCAVGAPAPGMHSSQGADHGPIRAWYRLPRQGPTRLARPRPQRYPGRKVMRLELLFPDCAHICCGARHLPPP